MSVVCCRKFVLLDRALAELSVLLSARAARAAAPFQELASDLQDALQAALGLMKAPQPLDDGGQPEDFAAHLVQMRRQLEELDELFPDASADGSDDATTDAGNGASSDEDGETWE